MTRRDTIAGDVPARAARHAALGDPIRLRIVDELTGCDRSPAELGRLMRIGSNLLAHHLGVLERVGLVSRHRSSGDRRRCYVRLEPGVLAGLTTHPPALAERGVVFVCTRNSARSQLAAALWARIAATPADSAGTHPADRVHPGAIAAAARAGLDLSHARPRPLDRRALGAQLVVTVCDRAHEELDPPPSWRHWSIPDPAERPTARAFDATVVDLRARIADVAGAARMAGAAGTVGTPGSAR